MQATFNGRSSNATRSNWQRTTSGRLAGPSQGRGGRALLAGLLSCAQCGRRLHVSYGGRTSAPTYACRSATKEGRARCVSFGNVGVEAAVTGAVLRAVSPLAIEAALEAERQAMEEHREGRRLMELELEQARYEASLAERRYAACDPDNRLIAARLEKIWEEAEQRVADFEARVAQPLASCAEAVDFTALAEDLEAAWNAPGTTMRARQRLLRSAIEDIIAGIDEAAREITLVIHWHGGRHSHLRITKRESGAHTRTSDDALKVIASMTGPRGPTLRSPPRSTAWGYARGREIPGPPDASSARARDFALAPSARRR